MNWNLTAQEVSSMDFGTIIPHTEPVRDGIMFTAEVPEGERASVLLYDRKTLKKAGEVPFPKKPFSGSVYAVKVPGIRAEDVGYSFRIGRRTVQDPDAEVLLGAKEYGRRRGENILGGFITRNFDWGDDSPLHIPYRDSVFYELNVRGFTKGRKSGVRAKGTFTGIVEKIPYLRSLGITAVVLMPCYDFNENVYLQKVTVGGPAGESDPLKERAAENIRKTLDRMGDSGGRMDSPDASAETAKKESAPRVNLWGFGPGFLFAPKASYCVTDDPYTEFCSMVKALHQAGIEVIMEMDFPRDVVPSKMTSVLLWWKKVYHVDGFMLFGSRSDICAVGKDPVFSDTKLISEYFPPEYMYPEGRKTSFRSLAECNRGFQNDARRILKGDEGVLQAYIGRSRYNPKDTAVVNQITFHDGFTLMDLVSYNDAHNEANGEGNRDGGVQYSWNCGTEGPTRKKDIMRLRLRQIRNAFSMLFLSQGTPMILAGDELGNTQKGDSNAWCFDSELTWLDWSSSAASSEILDTVRMLSKFRRCNPLLHQEKELSSAAMGEFFPQISCHGTFAWFSPNGMQDRSAGLMFCGNDVRGADILYVAYNFHWEKKDLALPFLPEGKEWKIVFCTSQEETETGKSVSVPGRSILVLEGTDII